MYVPLSCAPAADAVYTFALGYPDGDPTIPELLRGTPKRVQAYVERCEMKDVPLDADANAAFCVDVFARMDERLATRAMNGHFDGLKLDCPPKCV